MEQALHLQSSLNNLTDDEFNLFSDQLFATFGKRTILTTSLFYLLLNYSKQNNDKTSLEINKILRNITNFKQKNKNSTKTLKLIPKFNNIPSVLIAETASYLNLQSYFNLNRTNRHCAIALHKSTLSLTNLLNKCWFQKFMCNYGHHLIAYQLLININKLRSVKRIAISWNDFKIMHSSYGISKIWKWNDLDLLTIHSLRIDFDYIEPMSQIIDIISKIQIKQLRIFDCLLLNNDDFIDFTKIICSNKNIECLSLPLLTRAQPDTGFDYTPFNKLTNLRGMILNLGIHFYPTIFYENIMNYLCQQLQSIHITLKVPWHTDNALDKLLDICLFRTNGILFSLQKKTKYPKLEELCVDNLRFKEMVYLIKLSSNLKRLHWNIISHLNLNINQNTFIKLFDYCPFLENVFIGGHYNINELLSITNLIFLNITKKKNDFKLKIESTISMNTIHVIFLEGNLLKSLNNLNQSVINWNLKIIIQIGKRNFLHIKKNIIKKLKKKYMIDIMEDKSSKYKISFSNKDNKINEYNTKWLFSCNHCDFH